MNRIQAEIELTWYFNHALVKLDLSAIDYEAVTCHRPGWQYQDPNVIIATRSKPMRQALSQIPPRARRILEVAFTERAWRAEPDHTGKSPRYTLLAVFGARLAPVVKLIRPKGSDAVRKEKASAALRAALQLLCDAYPER